MFPDYWCWSSGEPEISRQPHLPAVVQEILWQGIQGQGVGSWKNQPQGSPSPQFGWLTTKRKSTTHWSEIEIHDDHWSETKIMWWVMSALLGLIWWVITDGCFDFDFPNSNWKRDEYDAVKARHGAPLGQGSPRSTLWCASRWPYYHWRWRFCTHTVKSVSISEMLESATTDQQTPFQSL